MSNSIKIVIDTDPGVDDAIAILMALALSDSASSPPLPVELLGLTTVGGNVPLARATRNALALLEYAQRTDVPVVRGYARPIKGYFPYAYGFHGKTGLSRRLPEPQTRPTSGGAVDFLASQLQAQPGEVTLVALGPLTNLAYLQRQHPGRLELARSLVVMGGAVDAPGNVTPQAEFNFYSDPLAAHEVVSSGIPLTLVDLGACRRVAIDREAAARVKSRNRLGKLVVQLLNNWFQQHPDLERFEFYDPLAVAAALDPTLLQTRKVSLAVETTGQINLGASRVTGEVGNVLVAEQVDGARFMALMAESLGLEGLLL